MHYPCTYSDKLWGILTSRIGTCVSLLTYMTPILKCRTFLYWHVTVLRKASYSDGYLHHCHEIYLPFWRIYVTITHRIFIAFVLLDGINHSWSSFIVGRIDGVILEAVWCCLTLSSICKLFNIKFYLQMSQQRT